MTLTKDSSPAEVRTEWVKALRSGDYKQGKGGLRNYDNEFCCLGVLCDLASQAGMGEWDGYGYVSGNSHMSGVPPHHVAAWAGLRDPYGTLNNSIEYQGGVAVRDADALTGLNDEAGYTFEQIADVIESGNLA